MKRNLVLPQLPDVLEGVQSPKDWSRRREELKEILFCNEYGRPLPKPESTTFEVLKEDKRFCASKATHQIVKITARNGGEEFSFPIHTAFLNDGKRHPTVVDMKFADAFPDKYLPVEELLDGGLNVISFNYEDVTADNGDFTNGAAAFWHIDRTLPDAPGKIMLWAWAAGLVADYLATCNGVDMQNLAVAGHSRLGKTALVAGALDERFAFVYSNDSGCSGDALFHGKSKGSEDIASITDPKHFFYWFCPAFAQYANRENDLFFDQHFLLALTAPRNLYCCSAALDDWADPINELRCCLAVNPVYELLGKKGLVCTRMPRVGTNLHEGNVGYHNRKGTHYHSREDWGRFVRYMMLHKNG